MVKVLVLGSHLDQPKQNHHLLYSLKRKRTKERKRREVGVGQGEVLWLGEQAPPTVGVRVNETSKARTLL